MAQQQIAASIFNTTSRARTAALIRLIILTAVLTTVPTAQAQTFTVLHNFTGGQDGKTPYTGLTIDRSGNLYGTTAFGGFAGEDCEAGGPGGCGVVFKLAHRGSGWVLTPLYQFHGFPSGDGAMPFGRVIVGPDGALYGTTAYGGQLGSGCQGDYSEPGCGSVFRLTPPATFCRSVSCTWNETQLYAFSGATDGAYPMGEIAFDAAGNLYGAAETGGPGHWGTAYELTPAPGTWTYTLLHGFQEQLDGGELRAGVQLDRAGNVYGTNNIGGEGQDGIAFQLVPSGSGWTLNIMYNFALNFFAAGLIVDPAGNLYGGTVNGNPNPVVFELSPSNGNWLYSTLYTFSAYQHCCGVEADLVMDSAGNLYGTTSGFSEEQIYGSVFELTPSNGGWIYTDLHDFTGGSDGGIPYSNVVLDANGNLYGTASVGGANGDGVVWEITR